ncbi:hypothetical protein O181_007852 [Austropuccinia psidii MF-1]|uniref:Uncharacterized protein n=1 Tax=Austropuccinia psidii MF-1 TaxID=1389203 RepID=A0A9Q3BNM1_9BASI|nr:hypothetical protein [Austropuccinia psidii MF-1]
MVHIEILKKCGGELENALRSKWIEPCPTDEYINLLEDIVKRAKSGRKWKKLDTKSPNKPFLGKINKENLPNPINPTIIRKENAINMVVLDT